MTLDQLFLNSKSNNLHLGQNYEVLNAPEKVIHKTKLSFRCVDCYYVFQTTPSVIFRGDRPCYCGKKSFGSPDRRELKLKALVEGSELVLIEYDLSKVSGEIKFSCKKCNHITTTKYSSFVGQGTGCAQCNGKVRKTESELIEELTECLKNQRFSLIKLDYKDTEREKLRVSCFCHVCDDVWETSVQSIRCGCRCPTCAAYGFNPKLPSFLYLMRIVSEYDFLIGYKYGITSDINRRTYEHNQYNESYGITFELSQVWAYKDGRTALKHERTIKDNFKPHFSKKDFPKGYTETISVCEFGDFLDLQTKQFN